MNMLFFVLKTRSNTKWQLHENSDHAALCFFLNVMKWFKKRTQLHLKNVVYANASNPKHSAVVDKEKQHFNVSGQNCCSDSHARGRGHAIQSQRAGRLPPLRTQGYAARLNVHLKLWFLSFTSPGNPCADLGLIWASFGLTRTDLGELWADPGKPWADLDGDWADLDVPWADIGGPWSNLGLTWQDLALTLG